MTTTTTTRTGGASRPVALLLGLVIPVLMWTAIILVTGLLS